jgi:hypothetical protein
MSKQTANAFEEILSTFSSDEDRQAFTSLAERNPQIREYGLRQADYSRVINENRDSLEELKGWKKWEEQNWDREAKTTKAEAELARELESERRAKAELEKQIAFGDLGGDVNFADIEGDLNKFLETKGVVTKDLFQQKEQEFRTVQGASMTAALVVPYLNQKHQNEFGELFNPAEFVSEAVKKGRFDLEDYYDKDFVVPKREAQRAKKHQEEMSRIQAEAEAKVAAAQKEADERVARVQGMGPAGGPTDADGPQMGAFQRNYLKVPEEGTAVPANSELGQGTVAAIAAREWRQKQANR